MPFVGVAGHSGLFERALQRVLVLPREIHHLMDLGLGDLARKDPAYAHALLVNMQHHPGQATLRLGQK